MRNLIVSLVLAVFGTTVYAAEDTPLIVVELYTSEGCSSCPPADRILTDLAARDNILALALHVDYWDYLGWKDTFSMAKFTKRQENYNLVLGSRYRLVTPQMIFHGQSYVAGANPKKIEAHLRKLGQLVDKVRLNIEEQAGAYRISIGPNGAAVTTAAVTTAAVTNAGVTAADVFIVRYKASDTTQVRGGENRGMLLKHTNIVTSWERLGEWKGQRNWVVKRSVADGEHLAVIVQMPDNGPILAARKLQ